MKLVYSIRFKLLFWIVVVFALFIPFSILISAKLGTQQITDTYGHSVMGPDHQLYEPEVWQGHINGTSGMINENTKRWATILAHLTFGSLREAMAKYDVDAMSKIVQMARSQKDIEAVRIFGPKLGPSMQGEVRFNGDTPENPKAVQSIDCGACHTPSGTLGESGLQAKADMVDAQARIDDKLVTDINGDKNLEMIVHVYNQEDPCWQCHKATQKVNGVIQVNVSLSDVEELKKEIQQQVKQDADNFKRQIIVLGSLAGISALGILFWIATVIVNRLAKLRYVAERVSLGETDVTLDDIPVSKDEIGELRDSFERMLVAVKFFMMPEDDFPEEGL